MKVEGEPSGMSEGRALLTEREREALAGEETGSYRYKTRTYLRNRLEKLERDAELLAEHEPELFDRLQAVVCDSAGADRERRETPAEEPAGETDVVDTTRREDTHTPRETPPFADIVDEIAEDVLPGSGAKLEARREALHAAVEYLRERGQATPSDFQTDVYPEHTGRYTDGDDPARSWWKNCVYKGLRELAERTDLVEKADTTGEWSWRGESA